VAGAYTESALQSRGGDGFLLGDSDGAGINNSSATALAVARLPEHEVRGDCGLQRRAAGLGLTRKRAPAEADAPTLRCS